MTNLIELSSSDFDNFYLRRFSNYDVIILYYADWCGYCTEFKPLYEKLSIYFPNIKFTKINVDKNMKFIEDNNRLLYSHKIESYPTIMFYKNGYAISRYNNQREWDKLVNEINSLYI
jgi:protein disulfide-isomerase